MLYYIHYMTPLIAHADLRGIFMSRGASGRIVIEIDPAVKQRLYSVLALEGKTLKQWFLYCVDEYLQRVNQPQLPFDHPAPEKPNSDGKESG